MLNLLRAEFHKLKTSKIFWVMMLSGIIEAIAGPSLSVLLRKMNGENIFLYSFQIQQFLQYMTIIGAFGYFVGTEFQSGSIKNLIAYGHQRRDIIIAKSIAFYTGTVLISFVFPILITLINTAMNGYGRPFNLQAFLLVLRVSFLMTLIFIGMSSIIIMAAFVSKNAIVPTALFIALDPVCRFGQALSLKSELIKNIYSKTIFYQLNTATLKNITFYDGLNVAVISVITLVISTTIAIAVFRKADVK